MSVCAAPVPRASVSRNVLGYHGALARGLCPGQHPDLRTGPVFATILGTGHNSPPDPPLMPKFSRVLLWIAVSTLGALALATIALHRGEQINALWLVVAAVSTYAVGYRFYSSFISAKVLALDPMRATPAERLDNGRDFVPTNKWVVFGHH